MRPLLRLAADDAGLEAVFLDEDSPLEGLRLLFVLNLDPYKIRSLKRAAQAALQENDRLRIIPLDRRDSQATLDQGGLLSYDPKVELYWRANGATNLRRLLHYAAITYLGAKGIVEPPVSVPESGYYLPDSSEALTTLDEVRSKARWQEGRPVAALLIQQSFWVTEDTQVIDAQVHALEREGFDVVTLFSEKAEWIEAVLREVRPDVLVEDRHGILWTPGQAGSILEELDVPYLRPISMLRYTISQWKKDPRGLAVGDRGLFLSVQESKGPIEPIVVGGLKADIQGYRLHEPIQERVQRFASRARAWAHLRVSDNQEKRIAIIYYNKYLGRGDLMRGSPTGGFLDAPESLVRFLRKLQTAGYQAGAIPEDAAQLLGWLQERGRNVGPWARGALEALADAPGVTLLPASRYEQWFRKRLSRSNQAAVEAHFGPPPGELMVVERNGMEYLVIPGVRLGNVLLAPQPERGESQDEALLHSRDVPPPHNYLAFYWWLQEGFHADAILHWGTHGSLELLPGKESGLSADDWSDLCVGSMPVINPWIMDNLGEATLSRRRSYAVLVDHQVPAVVNAGLTGPLRAIHDDIDKFDSLEPGLLREEFRSTITQAAARQGIIATVEAALDGDGLLEDRGIRKVAEYLHEIYNTATPTRLHVLGQPPPEDVLAPYLVSILGRPFLNRVAGVWPVPDEENRFEGDRYKWLRARAEGFLESGVLEGSAAPAQLAADAAAARSILTRLNQAHLEIDNLIRALDGRFVPPGPGPDPIRNPRSIPSGRNLYALNPEEIPTRASWGVAKRLADELIRTRNPEKVGFDLNGMNTMRDFGVVEGQILYLLGVRPVWDESNLVADIELIPAAELGRPRVDVFIAMGGQYKENFPSRVALLDKAVRLTSALDEERNHVREGTERVLERLRNRGFEEAVARELSVARIFGTKPGNLSGTNILHLIPRSGVWENEDEVASVYLDSMSYAYSGKIWGEQIEGLYEEAIQGTTTLVRVWASNMTSQLSNHHAYEYLGGLSMAVKRLTGNEPAAFVADVRDPDGARLRKFEEVLATTLRAELLNGKWIQGMQGHGYAGAAQMAELVKNTFGWAVTRASSVPGPVWDQIHDLYVRDSLHLQIPAWFERVNPHAMQEIAASMLEAARKGYWHPGRAVLANLSRLYARSVVEHGPSSGLVSGGNRSLEEVVLMNLDAPGDSPLASGFEDVMRKSSDSADAPRVHGRKLESVHETTHAPDSSKGLIASATFGAGALLLILLGYFLRSGSPA